MNDQADQTAPQVPAPGAPDRQPHVGRRRSRSCCRRCASGSPQLGLEHRDRADAQPRARRASSTREALDGGRAPGLALGRRRRGRGRGGRRADAGRRDRRAARRQRQRLLPPHGHREDALQACELLVRGVADADRPRRGQRRAASSASRASASTPRRTRSPTPRRAALGRGIYALRRARRARALEARALRGRARRRAPTSFDGWSVVAANTSVYGGGMYIAPDARLDDGLLDVVLIARRRAACAS